MVFKISRYKQYYEHLKLAFNFFSKAVDFFFHWEGLILFIAYVFSFFLPEGNSSSFL